MNLDLRRYKSRANTTLGSLYIDGEFQCFTLEDVVREVIGEPVSKWKVKGETAIPVGRYEVQLTLSQRFGRILPILLNVPGFSGIRIHSGNTTADTEGCILVGENLQGGNTILQSRAAMSGLMAKLQDAVNHNEKIWITVS